jgi:hypothetical protein
LQFHLKFTQLGFFGLKKTSGNPAAGQAAAGSMEQCTHVQELSRPIVFRFWFEKFLTFLTPETNI